MLRHASPYYRDWPCPSKGLRFLTLWLLQRLDGGLCCIAFSSHRYVILCISVCQSLEVSADVYDGMINRRYG